ncbi:AAA family ATPase [Microlunatus ginsengisoli]|uniref:ATP-binding protein n=1 Tax=Microlunatus ginsengisoli TaxID=363863 RepID=A0ABP6ZCM3_9ACTN
MVPTMADRLDRGRARAFVGRRVELAGFAALLASPEPAVVIVHGPAGIGKSTLIRQFASLAEDHGAACWSISGRDLPPTVEALEVRLAPVLGGPDPAPSPTRQVVLIDDYELLASVDTALRDAIAPRLPGDIVLVLAGQHAPSVGWRTDEGWSPLLHVIALGGLDRADCDGYLTARGVPADLVEPVVAFSHGHPLALALAGELTRQKGALTVPESADVVATLMDRLLHEVTSAEQRAAIEAAAQVRALDEPLLAALLDQPDCYELFRWLRARPYVQTGATGLVLHDLVREVVSRDLRWRHPERHVALHERARTEYLARLDHPDPAVQALALLDLIFLHPDLRGFLQTSEASAALRLEPARAGDGAAIEAMIGRHEGADSAAIARHWLAERPADWWSVRGPDGAVEGALCLLPLERLGADDAAQDPAVAAARAELASHPPLRPGETATLFRFWLAAETYQSVSAAQSIIATQFARHFLTTRALAVTLIPFAEPGPWEAFCAYVDQRRAPRADFTVGGRTYACFGHDWRIVPPAEWLARLSRQEVGVGGPADPPPSPAPAPPVLVLDESTFAAEVRQALRSYSRPDRLRTSPLLRCRFVTTRLTGSEGVAETVEVLRGQLKEAADSLADVPADRRLHRVLVRAYLSPAPSLERAAEVLELPSSTFRRLLGTACGRVATLLWHRELDA